MTAKILDGKQLARLVQDKIAENIKSRDLVLQLDIILVGEDPASQVYVKIKKRACEAVGITPVLHSFPESTDEDTVKKRIAELNADGSCTGILVQLPLPSHINREIVLSSISPKKDVDGLTPMQQGLLQLEAPDVVACTPLAIKRILDHYHIPLKGAYAVIIGSSPLIGRPLATLLLNEGSTVTLCNSSTPDVSMLSRQADIIVVAVGIPNFLQPHMVRKDAVIIDVGINKTKDGLCGDADMNGLMDKASAITPVPGGVGPMTVAMVLENLVRLWDLQHSNIDE